MCPAVPMTYMLIRLRDDLPPCALELTDLSTHVRGLIVTVVHLDDPPPDQVEDDHPGPGRPQAGLTRNIVNHSEDRPLVGPEVLDSLVDRGIAPVDVMLIEDRQATADVLAEPGIMPAKRLQEVLKRGATSP